MTVKKLEITEGYKADNIVMVNIKKALETNYCSFITSDKIGDLFFKVHDGYVIYNKEKNDYWYIQSTWTNGKRDCACNVKKYAESQWKKLAFSREKNKEIWL